MHARAYMLPAQEVMLHELENVALAIDCGAICQACLVGLGGVRGDAGFVGQHVCCSEV
jgi:hypothetical protein